MREIVGRVRRGSGGVHSMPERGQRPVCAASSRPPRFAPPPPGRGLAAPTRRAGSSGWRPFRCAHPMTHGWRAVAATPAKRCARLGQRCSGDERNVQASPVAQAEPRRHGRATRCPTLRPRTGRAPRPGNADGAQRPTRQRPRRRLTPTRRAAAAGRSDHARHADGSTAQSADAAPRLTDGSRHAPRPLRRSDAG